MRTKGLVTNALGVTRPMTVEKKYQLWFKMRKRDLTKEESQE